MAVEPRKAHHSKDLKQELISRLNRIEGQVKAAKKHIEENAYCDDILNQLASIQAAISGASILLLENHIKSCVVDQIKNGDHAVVDELMKTVKRLTR